MKKPPPCPNGCTHTDFEHIAFDRGVTDGRAGKEKCPYKRRNLYEAWQTGYVVGKLDSQ